MRKLIFLSFPAVIVILAMSILFWWKNVSTPKNVKDSTVYEFLIIKGEPLIKTANRLEEASLIKSGLAFRLYVQFKGLQNQIKAGDYRLSPNLTLGQMVLTLLKGPEEIWVTYPEGLRREEIAEKTVEALELKPADAVSFYQAFLDATDGKEGYLFPDTYLFPREITAEKVAQKLVATFSEKITDQMTKDLGKTNLALDEAIVVASIVERETITDVERPVVAGILLTRREIGMALQADATLQYITGTGRCSRVILKKCEWWKSPTVEDKKLKSSYNTYQIQGFPPLPIANPGISSLKAVIYPEKSDYLYYLHGGDGQIRYGRTLDEHNENIRKYL